MVGIPDLAFGKQLSQNCSGSQSPACIKYRRITGPADNYGLSSFGCGSSSTTLVALSTPIAAAGAARSTASSTTDGFGGFLGTISAGK